MLISPFKTVCILMKLVLNGNYPIDQTDGWADDYTVWILDKLGIYTVHTERGGGADVNPTVFEMGWKHRKD